MNSLSPKAFLTLVVILSACSGNDDLKSHAANAVSPNMPAVRFIVSSDTGAGPATPASNLAVGPRGEVLVTDYDGAPVPLHLIDPATHRDRGFSHHGEGPGEIRYPMPLAVTDSTVTAWDLANWRVTRWTHDGTVLASYSLRGTIGVVAVITDDRLLGVRDRSEGSFPIVVDLESGRMRDVVSPQDTFYQALFGIPGRRLERLPVIGAWSGGVLIGDDITYRIGLYDWDGKLQHVIDRRAIGPNLPTAKQVAHELMFLRGSGRLRSTADVDRARNRIASTPIAWFSRLGPPRSDSHGRLWVIGQHSDSTFADIFANDAFLGRIWLDCKEFGGRWSLNRDWIALPCAPDDPHAERDGVVKLWRIVEKGS